MLPATIEAAFAKSVFQYLSLSLLNASRTRNSVSLVFLIRKHRLEGHLYTQLRHDLPHQQIIQRYLDKTAPFIIKRQNALVGAYKDIVLKLKEAGVGALPLKSIALTLEEGKKFQPRIFDDIDIIIAPHDISRAIAVLNSSGFIPCENISYEQIKDILSSLGSVNFTNDSRTVNVDLHIDAGWKYFPRPIQFDSLLPVSLMATSEELDQPLLLDKVNHAMVILYAGTKDLWPKISSVIDLTLLLTSFNEIERRGFLRIVSQYNLWSFLDLFQSLQYDLSLPKIFSNDLTKTTVKNTAQIKERIVSSWVDLQSHKRFNEKFRAYAHLKLLGDFKSRCNYVLARTFVHTENDLTIKNRFIRTPLRVIRIVKKMCLSIMKD